MSFCSVLRSTYLNEKTHYSSMGRAILHRQLSSYFILEIKQGDSPVQKTQMFNSLSQITYVLC